MPKIKLPPKLHEGHVLHIRSVNCVEINLFLDFNVSVVKKILLEGVEIKDILPQARQSANRCLIVLIGGKDVIVHTNSCEDGEYTIGRIYLNERVYGTPPGMYTPYGLDVPMLEISTFYRSLAPDYDIEEVKAVLNGSRGGVKA